MRPKLAAITVSRCHLILVFRRPGELADLEHVQAERFYACVPEVDHAVIGEEADEPRESMTLPSAVR